MAQTKSNPIGALAYLGANPDTETTPDTNTATTPTSDSILANMQKRMDEINSPRNQFENQLQKAHAWTLYNKSPAFKNIAEQEDQQFDKLQNIATTMAQIKMQRDRMANVSRIVNGGGAPSVNAGGTNTNAGTSMAGVGSSGSGLNQLLEKAILLSGNDPDFAQQVFKETGIEQIKGVPNERKIFEWIKSQPPETQEMLLRQHFPKIYEPNKQIVTQGDQAGETLTTPSYMQSQESAKTPIEKPSTLPPNVSSGPGPRVNSITGVTEQHAGYDIPFAANTPVTAKSHELLNPILGGKVLDVKPTSESGGYGNTAVIQGTDGKNYRLAHFNDVNVKPGDTITSDTIIGAAGNTGKSRGNHLHIEEIKGKQPSQVSEQGEIPTVESKERLKQFTDAQLKEAGLETGKRRATLEKSRSEISNNERDALTILNILDKSPKSVGLTYANPLTGNLAEGIKFVTGKNIEPILEKQLSPNEIKNRKEFEGSAKKLSLAYRSSIFKGTGSVSDLETKAADEATGLQKENPAEATKYFAILYAENFRAQKEMINAWDDYQKTHGGSKADYAEFERTNQYKNIFKEKDNRLKSHFPELSEESGIAFGETQKPTKPSEDELNTWKNRYGKKSTSR